MYTINVSKGGMVGFRRDLPDNPPFSAIFLDVPKVENSGCTLGVFLNTADGAVVKLERFISNGKQKAKFTALAGNRQVPLCQNK